MIERRCTRVDNRYEVCEYRGVLSESPRWPITLTVRTDHPPQKGGVGANASQDIT